jgi:Tfp pilus assembly protein PilE
LINAVLILYDLSMKLNNKGFGFAQILIVLVILGTAGILAFKNYYAAGQKTLKESEKLYEEQQPAQNFIAASGNTVMPSESVHVRKAKELEGKVFLSSIMTAERTYEAVNGSFFYTGWTKSSPELGITSMGNQYFKEFTVEKKSRGGFTVKVRGSGELEGIILTSDD